jgi:uncharacterized DUF497 family protein
MNAPAAFDWDDGNRDKCQCHGVPLDQIEQLFRRAPHIAPDLRHSDAEDRFIAVGKTRDGRALFVAFTLRRHGDRQLIRPVSARYMHRKEAARYGKEGS